jgi:hypothetical protein
MLLKPPRLLELSLFWARLNRVGRQRPIWRGGVGWASGGQGDKIIVSLNNNTHLLLNPCVWRWSHVGLVNKFVSALWANGSNEVP